MQTNRMRALSRSLMRLASKSGLAERKESMRFQASTIRDLRAPTGVLAETALPKAKVMHQILHPAGAELSRTRCLVAVRPAFSPAVNV